MPSSKAKSAAKGSSKAGKKKKKKRSPEAQDAGQPSGGSVASRGSKETKQGACCPCCRRRSPDDSPCSRLLACLGLRRRKKTDDMVRFDETASMESSLLWSKDGTEPTAEDYLDFAAEHEREVGDFASRMSLPKPEKDKTDY